MSTGALIFMLIAWVAVLGLTVWSYAQLMKAPKETEHLPPPGSIP
jgi:type IV secretory pathway TrbD component